MVSSFFGCRLVCRSSASSASSATSVAFWLVTLPFIKFFAALNLVLPLPEFDLLSNFGFFNVKFRQLLSFFFVSAVHGWFKTLYVLLPCRLLWVFVQRPMLPYQTSADKALWLTYDLFAELVHKKPQEKQIELLDLKGNPLSEAQFIQIQWDARVARRTSNLCEERLIVCIDYLS